MHDDVNEAIGQLRAAVDALVAVPVDALDEPTIRRLTRVQTCLLYTSPSPRD